MKKSTIWAVTLFLSLSSLTTLLSATEVKTNSPISTTIALANESKESKSLTDRLNEINKMDFSTMSFSEKHVLRKEARSIKSKVRRLKGGVYISAGGIIIGKRLFQLE